MQKRRKERTHDELKRIFFHNIGIVLNSYFLLGSFRRNSFHFASDFLTHVFPSHPYIHSHFLLYLLRITSLSLSRFFSSVELWDEKGREKLLVRQNGRRIPPRLRLSSSVSRQFAVWGHVGRKEAASVCDLCVLNITHSACFFFCEWDNFFVSFLRVSNAHNLEFLNFTLVGILIDFW